MTARRRYIVTYDIAEDRRRAKVHKAMLDFGDPVQYSVFICELDDRERICLNARLAALIDHRADQVLTVDLGPASREVDMVVHSIGRDFMCRARVVVV